MRNEQGMAYRMSLSSKDETGLGNKPWGKLVHGSSVVVTN